METEEELAEAADPDGMADAAEEASLAPTTPRSYTCQVCDKVFPTSTRYHKHVKLHTTEKTFHCASPGCGKSFKRQTHLQRHMAQHQVERPHACDRPGCGTSFASQQKLAKHVRCVHDGFNCEVCGERFRKQGKLQTHMLTHNAKVELLAPQGSAPPGLAAAPAVAGLQCPQCDKVVGNAQAMHRHLKRHKEHRCEPCGAVFAHFTDLVHHRRSEHARMYLCSDCGRSFHREGHLRAHALRVHSRELLVCPREDCGQVFASKSNLNVHERTSHERLKLFPCDKCSASFAYRHVLLRHQQIMHSGDRTKASANGFPKPARSTRAASGQVLLKRLPPGRKRKATASEQPAFPSSSSVSRPKIEPEGETETAPSFSSFPEHIADSRSKAELEAEADAALDALASSVPLDLHTMAERAAAADAALEAPVPDICMGLCRCSGPCAFRMRKSSHGVSPQTERNEEEQSEYDLSEDNHSEQEQSEEGELEVANCSSQPPACSSHANPEFENTDGPSFSSASRPKIEPEAATHNAQSIGSLPENVIQSKRKAELEAEAEAALESLASSVPLDLKTTAKRAVAANVILDSPAPEMCVGPCQCQGPCVFRMRKSLRTGVDLRHERNEEELSAEAFSEDNPNEEERAEEDDLTAADGSASLRARSSHASLELEDTDGHRNDVSANADPSGTCRSKALPPTALLGAMVLSSLRQPCRA